MPVPQRAHDFIDLALLVLEALAGIHIGNMDDGFQCRVQHLGDGINVAACIEEVADVQRLEPAVAVELLVVGVSHRLKPGFFRRGQHGFAVTTEI
ncbi:hypothetical protein D3C72_2050740 [compost metagenome]